MFLNQITNKIIEEYKIYFDFLMNIVNMNSNIDNIISRYNMKKLLWYSALRFIYFQFDGLNSCINMSKSTIGCGDEKL